MNRDAIFGTGIVLYMLAGVFVVGLIAGMALSDALFFTIASSPVFAIIGLSVWLLPKTAPTENRQPPFRMSWCIAVAEAPLAARR